MTGKQRVRMTGAQRRGQLLDVARSLFSAKGFDATSIEELAARAEVSKPVVYEHFGGKEGVYAAVVDREVHLLLDALLAALADDEHPRVLLERAALVLLDYVESASEGFRILTHDSPDATFAGPLGTVAGRVERILAVHLGRYGYRPDLAALYTRALMGMVAFTGQWWLATGTPEAAEVAAHLVNLAWNGLARLDGEPGMRILATDSAPDAEGNSL